MEILFPSTWFSSAALPSPSYNGATRSDEEGVMGEESSTNTGFNLPKLRYLELRRLPELRSICSAKLICNSLEIIEISNCEKLRRLPICLPLLENGQPSPPPSLKEITAYPEKWWESVVEWEHPNAKDVLHPFVRSEMDGGRMRCNFCGHLFAKGTSISRIKLHLAGVTGRGVKTCGQVPQDVQDAALAAIDGPPEKKLKTVAGSSNNDVTNEISASAQQQNNEMMMARQREDLSLEVWMASITVEDMELLERGSFHERPSFNQADEPRGDPSQPTNDQLCSPSVNNDVIMNVAQNVVGVGTEPVVRVLERSNAELDNFSVDAGRTQVVIQGMELGGEEERVCSHLDMKNSMKNTGEGSVHHVDRIVSPWRQTIDENDNRRGATERLVQPGVGASSSGGNMNHNAISTSTPQEQNNEVYNLTRDGTSIQAPDMYEKSMGKMRTFLMKDDVENGIGGVAQPGAGASSSVGLKHNTSETRGAPLPTGSTKLVGRAFEENIVCDVKISMLNI